MILYVVRHGQTNWNLEGHIQGHTDIDLNATGIAQSYEIAKKIKDIPIDVIISSPLNRALKTAQIINKYHNLPIKINTNLIERNFGDFEGSNLSSYGLTIQTLLDYKLNYNKNNIEPIQSLFKRVNNFIYYCKTSFIDKNVLILTHNGICQVLESILSNHPIQTDLLSLGLNNCEYRKYLIHN